jgi:PAS domain S-box-containing protein
MPTKPTPSFPPTQEVQDLLQALLRATSSVVFRMNADWSEMCMLETGGFLADTPLPTRDRLQRYIPEGDRPLLRVRLADALRAKREMAIEHRILLADGSVGWAATHAVPVLDARGEVAVWNGVLSDVTRRKRVELALRESEERLRTMAEVMDDVFYMTELDTGQLLYLSPAYEQVWGRPADELREDLSRFVDALHPDDVPIFERAKTVQARGEAVDSEYRIVRPDGEVRWIHDRSFPIPTGPGRRSAGVAVDITARKLAEQALRAREERQRFLLELGDRMRAARDPQAVIEVATRMLGEQLGASRIVYAEIDEAQGIARIREGWTAQGAERHPPELKLEDFGGPLLDDLRAGKTIRFDDVGAAPHARPDLAALDAIGIRAGVSVPLVVGGRFVVNLNVHQDRPRAWRDDEVALVEEVAERTWAAVERARAEADLRESRARYRLLFESIDQGFCIIEVLFDAHGDACDYRFVEVNPAFAALTGLEDAAGRRINELVPQLESFWYETYATVALSGIPQRFEHEAAALARWYSVYAFPFGDPGSRQVAVLFEDVTARRQADAALRRSEERLLFAMSAGEQYGWELDVVTRIATRSGDPRRVVGFDVPVDEPGRFALLHPDDVEHVRDAIDAAIESRGELEIEYRLIDPHTGEAVWLSDAGRFFRDGSLKFVGTTRNITERKRAELVSRESEERLQLALDASGLATWDWDMVDDRVTWSEQHFLMQGYAVGEVEPSFEAWAARVHPDDLPGTLAALQRARDTREEYVHELRSLLPDGSIKVMAARGRYFYDAAGRAVRMIGVMDDVTSHRMAEDAVRLSETRYHALFESMDEGLCVVELMPDGASAPQDYRIVETNAAFERLMLQPEGALARNDIVAPSRAPSWLELYARVARSGRTERFQASAASGRWFAVSVFPIVTGGARVATLFTDITRNRMAEQVLKWNQERQSLLLAFGDAAKATLDPRLIMAMAARMLGQKLRADRAGYAEVDPDNPRFTVVDDWSHEGVPPFAGTYPIAATGAEVLKLLTSGAAVASDDVRDDPRLGEEERGGYARASIAAFVAAPMVRQGKLAASLFLHQCEPRRWSEDEIALVAEMALRTSAELERARAEEALRVSEARFRQFGDASSDVLWIRDAQTLQREYVSPAHAAIYGAPARVGGDRDDHMELVHPDFRQRVQDAVQRVRAGERVQYEFKVCRPDGGIVWVQNTAFPLLDAAGRVQRIAGIGQDITAMKETEGRLQTLVTELQHRTRNVIAVVNSLARKTLDESETLEAFATTFQDRLAALARVQGLLSRLEESERVDFAELVRQELEAHGALGSERLSISGPDGVLLRSRTVQTLALALHELATNAVKHGALGNGGRLDLHWELEARDDEIPVLHVTWHETGVPITAADAVRGGYGRELIERALPYQHKARTRYELRADGVFCTIAVPLTETGRSEEGTGHG